MEKNIFREIISKENLPAILAEIGAEREKKGASELLIPRIRKLRAQAEKLGLVSAVLQLYQEEALCAQHMIMEEKSKKFRANPLKVAKAIVTLEAVTKTMASFAEVNSENLELTVHARVYRFLGRYADHTRQYKKSEEQYRKGLHYFENSTRIEERFNRLEFLGLLSFSLLKQGKTNAALSLVEKTLCEFDDSEEGKWLKEKDYYTWAVWKSGIQLRTAEHIIASKKSENKEYASQLVLAAESILVMPDGTTERFCLRIDELRDLKERLRL